MTGLTQDEMRLAAEAGCDVVRQGEAGYPAPLLQLPDPPAFLYIRGQWIDADRTAVAIVGSRQASFYGQEVAERLAYDLAVRGVTVVSGLARGIDAAAHRGALNAHGGRTIAVLGNGLSSVYPPQHQELAGRIAERGAVCSEYPMRAEPLPYNFPKRNRLISGLSLGVVVVEAAAHSGALITADLALEQGREVFAVPGPVHAMNSQGTHGLLKQGAKLVTSVEDIIEELRLKPLIEEAVSPAADGTSSPAMMVPARSLLDEERRVLRQLRADRPSDLDDIALKTRLPVSACASILLSLELKRLVRQLPGKRFVQRAVAGES